MDSWISNSYDTLADRPIGALMLPGTHDSAAFALAPPSSSGPVSPGLRDRLLWLLACAARPCVVPWTLTQHCCVHDQLARLGTRFLDVRVAWDGSRRAFITSHTFACVPLREVLAQVVAFLTGKGHEREVVFVCLRPDWPHRAGLAPPGRAAALLQEVVTACGGLLFPRGPALPTLGRMVASGRRLLVFVEGVPEPELAAVVDSKAEAAWGRARAGAVGGAAARGRLAVWLTARSGAHGSGCGAVDLEVACSRNEEAGGSAAGGEQSVWWSAGCQTIWADSDTPAGTVDGLLRMIAQMRRDGRLPATGGRGAGPTHAGEVAAPGWPMVPCGAAGPVDGAQACALYWYVSAAVTPSAGSVVRSVVADPRDAGLRRLAAQLEAEHLPALLAEGLAGVGAVCLDHPSPAASRAVIQLNFATVPVVEAS